jgi:hypothetical protein
MFINSITTFWFSSLSFARDIYHWWFFFPIYSIIRNITTGSGISLQYRLQRLCGSDWERISRLSVRKEIDVVHWRPRHTSTLSYAFLPRMRNFTVRSETASCRFAIVVDAQDLTLSAPALRLASFALATCRAALDMIIVRSEAAGSGYDYCTTIFKRKCTTRDIYRTFIFKEFRISSLDFQF